MNSLSPALRRTILNIQRDEITEYHIYRALARRERNPHRARILLRIAEDELRHYNYWKQWTGTDLNPSRLKQAIYLGLDRLFPRSFVLKLMEKGEEWSQSRYQYVANHLPQTQHILREEQEHEKQLLNLIEEDILRYMGSVVLGMNDALVEITGALAGMSQAIASREVIVTAAFLTGIAASLSMAAAEYLSTREEVESQSRAGETPAFQRNPLRAALITGISYIVVVILLILPFLLLDSRYLSLALTILTGIGIIAIFNFFSAVVNDKPFWRNFLESVVILGGVSLLSALIGWLARALFGIEL